MLAILLPILVLAAGAAWIVAVMSALSIFALAPKGSKLSAYFDLGWWRFDKLRTLIGPAAEPHLKRYRAAFLAFFAAIISVMVVVFATVQLT